MKKAIVLSILIMALGTSCKRCWKCTALREDGQKLMWEEVYQNSATVLQDGGLKTGEYYLKTCSKDDEKTLSSGQLAWEDTALTQRVMTFDCNVE